MLEVEMKYAGADFSALERQLRAWGAVEEPTRTDADHYFNAPDRDFAATDEALRLRRIGERNFVTYKGPKRDQQTKTRTEIEVPIAPGDTAADDFSRLLVHLGYRPVAVVRKTRRLFHLQRNGFALEATLDDVDGVGRFAELEIQAPEEQFEAARKVLLQAAAELGLTSGERRSYLELLLAARGQEIVRPPVVSSIEATRRAVADARRRGLSIGLVPTMGALHEGHASLIRAARQQTGFVVVTIFVNPAQFGPHEDLSRYPRPLEQDLDVCGREGADLVFHPEPATIYPPGFCTFVEVTGLQDVMEGPSRPGHFRGVATVVLKLFNIVQPDIAYFGQKDGQQARIIQQMVADLNVPVEVRVCPTIRAADGLALSSRNAYLDAEQRRNATVLYAALQLGREMIETGERDPQRVRQAMVERIGATPGAVLDYAEVADAATLRPMERLRGRIMLAVAVRFGGARLIDNMLVDVAD